MDEPFLASRGYRTFGLLLAPWARDWLAAATCPEEAATCLDPDGTSVANWRSESVVDRVAKIRHPGPLRRIVSDLAVSMAPMSGCKL
jgi:hypothetical protein